MSPNSSGIQEDFNGTYATLEPVENKHKKYKKMFFISLIVMTILFVLVLALTYSEISPKGESKPFLTLLQINDVYEISPVSNVGGFARTKTVYQTLKKSENYVMTILAGDFYSPSALGVAPVKIDGDESIQALEGRHMVDVLNHIGCPKEDFLATWGNHEFDVSEQSYYKRVNESQFIYISTNVLPNQDHSPSGSTTPNWGNYPNVVPYFFKEVDGVKIAFISLTLYVSDLLQYAKILQYDESVVLLKNTINKWKKDSKEWDILVAVTHQSIESDIQFASDIPEIDIIIGGHEHVNYYYDRSLDTHHKTIIAKADSNTKSLFVHRLHIDHALLDAHKQKKLPRHSTSAAVPGLLKIKSELMSINNSIRDDPTMVTRVKYWTDLAFDSFAKQGLDPGKIMCDLTETINALDKYTRSGVSIIGKYIATAFLVAASAEYTIPVDDIHHQTLVSVLNIGSVRIDDYLLPGNLYQYDALRVLPFGGHITVTEMKGKVLKTLLAKARSLLNTGMWIGYDRDILACPASTGTPTVDCAWTFEGKPIDDAKIYSVVIPEYCVTKSWNSYFVSDSDFQIMYTTKELDQQHALISFFEKKWPLPKYF